MKLKLLHLYYDLMNLYGEYGNMKILESYLIDQGIEVEVHKKTLNDEIDFEEYDFIYMGSGTERNQIIVLEDLKNRFRNQINKYIEDGKLMLLTGNSYEVLGRRISNIEALRILDFETDIIQRRNTSDIIASSRLFSNKVVGFVNNMSSIFENKNTLFNIEFGIGENEQSREEGINYKGVIGTHLIGPLLVRNPDILKYLVNKLCTQKNPDFKYQEKVYEDEQKGYEIVLNELKIRKK